MFDTNELTDSCSGLQIRHPRFESGRGLSNIQSAQEVTASAVTEPTAQNALPSCLYPVQQKTAEIPLTQGQVAIIDVADLPLISQYGWCAEWKPKINGFYASGYSGTVDGRKRYHLMHRLLTGAGKGQVVHHKNHNGLDNRRCNLAVCTSRENKLHSVKRRGGTSRFKGVQRRKYSWLATIFLNGRRVILGNFRSEVEAALAYDRAAVEAFGEFALTNAAMGLIPLAGVKE